MRVTHYFAYGSNMNPERVRERGIVIARADGARLADYRLTFNKCSTTHAGRGHANIEYAPGSVVEGVLYRLVEASEILKMDPFERAPWNYGRDVVALQSEADTVWAWTYFANPAVMDVDLRPPRAYLEHLLAGAEFLSADYLAHLQSWHDAE